MGYPSINAFEFVNRNWPSFDLQLEKYFKQTMSLEKASQRIRLCGQTLEFHVDSQKLGRAISAMQYA